MTLSRAIALALTLVVLPLAAAHAQFGGMPGMPGSPGMGSPGGGFGAAPQQPPAACQQLITLRDETQKNAQAIQAAGQRQKKPSPDEACKLFKAYLGSEAKMIKALEQQATTCGVPPDMIKQVKAQHNQASQTGKQICEVAARGSQPTGPSFSDALGTTPLVPDNNDRTRGGGTFDTLTGNALQR
jgi:hypothetical protein